MRVFTSIFFLVCLAGSASATVVTAPGPELGTGVLGMSAAAGVIYLLKRRSRS
jgi:hypothetical protein